MRKWESSEKGKKHRAEYQRVWDKTDSGRAHRKQFNADRQQAGYYKARNDKHKAMAFEYLGGACVECGSVEALEFDHIEPATKSYKISRRYTSAWGTLLKELDKCQLLCVPCHRLKTNNERKVLV